MKRFLLALAVCLIGFGAVAQTVPYRQLNTSDFRADLYPAVRIQTNRFPSFPQFSTNYFSTAGGIITLSTAIVVVAESVWTNSLGLTTLRPGLGASVYIGTNTVPFWAPDSSDGYIVVHDQSGGENIETKLAIIATDGISPTNWSNLRVTVNSQVGSPVANLSLYSTTNEASLTAWSQFRVNLQPDANTAYIYLRNNGVTNFFVDSASGYTGTGTNGLSDDGTYKPFALQGATTNIFETTIITNVTVVSNLTVNATTIFNGRTTFTTNVFITNGSSLFIDGTNIAKINPTDNVIPVRLNTNTLGDSPFTVSGVNVLAGGNLLTPLSVGATNYFDLNFPTQTNSVSAALAFSFVTNGVAGYEGTILREFLNTSGSDQTVTWPTIASGVNGWRTNPAAALPPAFTNGTWTKVLVEVQGPTSTTAQQTNVHVLGVTYN